MPKTDVTRSGQAGAGMSAARPAAENREQLDINADAPSLEMDDQSRRAPDRDPDAPTPSQRAREELEEARHREGRDALDRQEGQAADELRELGETRDPFTNQPLEAAPTAEGADADAGEDKQPAAVDAAVESKDAEIADGDQDLPDDRLVTVKIDGKTRQVSLSEVLKSYQIEGTARRRLEEATRLLHDARKATATAAITPAKPAETPPEPPTSAAPADGKIDTLIEDAAQQLSYGTPDQIKESLRALVSATRAMPQEGPRVTADEIAQTVDRRLFNSRALDEASGFAADHQDVMGNPDLADLTLTRAERMMRDDLIEAGADPRDVGVLNRVQLGQYHAELRFAGMGRSLGDIMVSSADGVRKAYGLKVAPKAPAKTPLDQRRDAKAKAPIVPAAAAPRTSPAKPAFRAMSQQDLLNEERQARGLHPIAT